MSKPKSGKRLRIILPQNPVTVDQFCNKMMDNLVEIDEVFIAITKIIQELEVEENISIASDENLIDTNTREEVFFIEDRRNTDGDSLNYEMQVDENLFDEWNSVYQNEPDELITTDSRCKPDKNNLSANSETSVQLLNRNCTLNLEDSDNIPSLMKLNSEGNLMPMNRSSLQNFTTTESPFLCETCNAKFSNKEEFEKHKQMHFGTKQYICNICNNSFDCLNQLNMHRRLHKVEKPHICEFCGKRFTYLSWLSVHRRSHTREKPFVCEFCDQRFTHKGNLNQHIVIHTGERPFECEFCSQRFIQKSHLNQHIVIHTEKNPFVCDFCLNRFTRKSNLKLHKLTHTGEKP